MSEIWIQSNRRAVLPWIPAAVISILFAGYLTYAMRDDGHWRWLLVPIWALVCLKLLSLYLARRPSLRFDGKHLCINVGLPHTAVVPIELVEGFMLGKGPAYLSGKDDYKTEATTLVVRLAERAPEWEKRPTDVRVAAWCGHYVTLRGTWTEPLSVDVVNRLNQRLFEVQHATVTS
jgi:hypothetical protein